MRTETTTKTVYLFNELSDTAKETARDWWRQLEQSDFDTECTIEDAQRMGAILGIELATHAVTLMNGTTRRDPTVYWSGFSSQGDGACFEGAYRYAKGAAKAIRAEAPTDKTLHAIADNLQAAQRANFYRLEASCTHRGHYSHSGCMAVDVSDREDSYRDIGDADETVRQCMRDFADWIYRQLETEYEWRMADAQVDDAITDNEYEFDENGNRA